MRLIRKRFILALIAATIMLISTSSKADDVSQLSAMCAATLFTLDGVDARDDIEWFLSLTTREEYEEQLLLVQRAIDDDSEVVTPLLMQASKMCRTLRGDANDNVYGID